VGNGEAVPRKPANAAVRQCRPALRQLSGRREQLLGDSLPEARVFGLPEQRQKFRLPAQNDLQQFFLVSVRVAQQANLFQKFG